MSGPNCFATAVRKSAIDFSENKGLKYEEIKGGVDSSVAIRANGEQPNNKPLAHVSEDGRIHPLYDHLIGTADLAENFADEFGCREWGYLAGLWHDLGRQLQRKEDYP
ncbi:MAG TPA: hypothetical protein DCP92_14585 [Nitrospiraceae bacterium]|nr:hypothetical protein [Nitrospiraceae bacterium]